MNFPPADYSKEALELARAATQDVEHALLQAYEAGRTEGAGRILATVALTLTKSDSSWPSGIKKSVHNSTYNKLGKALISRLAQAVAQLAFVDYAKVEALWMAGLADAGISVPPEPEDPEAMLMTWQVPPGEQPTIKWEKVTAQVIPSDGAPWYWRCGPCHSMFPAWKDTHEHTSKPPCPNCEHSGEFMVLVKHWENLGGHVNESSLLGCRKCRMFFPDGSGVDQCPQCHKWGQVMYGKTLFDILKTEGLGAAKPLYKINPLTALVLNGTVWEQSIKLDPDKYAGLKQGLYECQPEWIQCAICKDAWPFFPGGEHGKTYHCPGSKHCNGYNSNPKRGYFTDFAQAPFGPINTLWRL